MSQKGQQIVRVGVIGCGEAAQVIHIPTLNNFNEFFQITYLCDTSEHALNHCEGKVVGAVRPTLTKRAEDVCSSPDVDLVFVINSNEYHAPHAVLGLQHGKNVFIEKPMAMNNRDVELILEAEKQSKGTVMVGYMRRWATAFQDALEEIGGLEEITYARVRDIIGRNAYFVEQSGSFPKRFSDYSYEDSRDLASRNEDWNHQGLTHDLGIPVTEQSKAMWLLLGGLGSHDLSLMREALGMPQAVLGCSLRANTPFWKYALMSCGRTASEEC